MSLPHTDRMFAGVPPELFRVHDWRNDVKTVGAVPKEFIEEITDGKYSHEYPVQLNKLVLEGGHDLIISVGQVCCCTHPIRRCRARAGTFLTVQLGRLCRTKSLAWLTTPRTCWCGTQCIASPLSAVARISVGCPGCRRSAAAVKRPSTRATLSALFMEWRTSWVAVRMRALPAARLPSALIQPLALCIVADDNPVRKLYNKAWGDHCSKLPVCWMQTVCAKDEATQKLAIRGFYTGTGYAPFVAAAELALKVNFEMLDEEVIILSAPRSAGNRCAACETGVGTTDHKGSCLSRPRGIYHDMVNMHGIWCVRVE